MITFGKSITSGMCPASYILGNDDVVLLVGPYSMSSTFGKFPAANIATLAALKVYGDEKLLERAITIGKNYTGITSLWKHPFV